MSSEPDEDDMNTGGRVFFKLDEPVMVLGVDGLFEKTRYFVDTPRSDRKGLVSLKVGSIEGKVTKVHNRRILAMPADGQIAIIKNGDKHVGVCPTCRTMASIEIDAPQYTCGKCGTTHTITYIGDRPMETEQKPKTAASGKKTERKPAAVRVKVIKEPVKLDCDAIAATTNLELWTKPQIKFDHVNVDVKAHIVLYTGPEPRKYCFNSYNGTLGRNATELPLKAFIEDQDVPGTKRKPWYNVKNLDSARTALQRDGYVKHQ